MHLVEFIVHFTDTHVHNRFLFLREDELIVIFKFITWLGNWQIVVPVLIGMSLFLYAKNHRKYILPLWISTVLSGAITFGLKLAVARPRPFDELLSENDFSFPSGHATIAVAFYGFLTYILFRHARTKNERHLYLFLGLLLIFFIGLSRLYLGVHYTSDVIAGYIVGSFGLMLGIFIQNSNLLNTKKG